MTKSKQTKNAESAQIKVRLSPSEREVLSRMIERAEKTAGLSKGTITAAGFVKSVLLNYFENSKK